LVLSSCFCWRLGNFDLKMIFSSKMANFAPGSSEIAIFYQQNSIKSQIPKLISVFYGWLPKCITKFHRTFVKLSRNLDPKWRKLKIKISLEPEFSGGQDIHQNSCNFKYFSVVIVPFLCASIFFILSRRVLLFW
jgi:hypothetical protein